MTRRPHRRLLAAAAIVLGAAFCGHAALAQTLTVQSITPSTPNLGNVVSAPTGDTVFTVAASTGNVTRLSGTGVRLTTGTTRATVTIACGNQNACNSTNVAVRIGSVGTPTGRAGALTAFTVSAGTATIVTAPSGSNPINLTLGPIGRSLTKTIFVGANFPINGDNSGKATGNAASGFFVFVAPAGTTPTAGSTAGSAIARVYRPISASLTSNLSFGRIVRPAAGTGTVTVNATTGARTLTVGTGLNTPSATRAVYSVTGEGGQAFSISVPATFGMTATGGSLTVTTSTTASGSQVLSSALGSAGTYSFGVGGSFPLASTTVTGAYSGTFNVTVQYN
jgi:hypothetical protein